jgi:peptidoglycan/LPS O-acetylase OafA/YrhL
MQKKDFPALTGIRFIAATFVFLSHYADQLVQSHNHFGYIFLRQLNVGVTLFFVLSGFLITHRYYGISYAAKTFQFYITKRIARIFPLYLFLLSIQFSLFFLQGKKGLDFLWVVFLNITLVKGLSAKYFLSGLAQSWSLTVEEIFYFFAPLSFYFIRVKKFFLLQIPILIGIGCLLVMVFSHLDFEGFFQSIYFLFSTTFFGRCFEFFVGIYISLLLINGRSVRTKNYTLWGSLLFTSLLLLLSFCAYQQNKILLNDSFVGILLFNFLIPVAIGIFYYGLLGEQTIANRILSNKWIVLLGKSSYAFYLLHIGMIAEVIYFHFTSAILLLYITLQLLSIAAYKVFEKPVYFFILRKFASQKHKPSLYQNG